MLKYFLLCLLFSSCATTDRTQFYQLNPMGGFFQKTYDRVLWENSMGADENVSIRTVLESDFASYHVLQVRNSEEFHRHDQHDLVVMMQTGTGIMFLKNESFRVNPGSVIFIPHGVPHYFLNTSPTPSSAIAVFSPRYDGKDYIPVTKK